MGKQKYKEKLEEERAALVAAGHVAERYSGVSRIEFKMTYYRRGLDPVLMKRELSFSPGSYAGFHMKCMTDGCRGGGYDLAPVVEGLIKNHRTSVKGKIFRRGSNVALGHASMDYHVEIHYAKPSH